MVIIKKYGKYYYVEGDDCYIFYYLFRYKINNKKCYFRKKYLSKVIKILDISNIDYKLDNEVKYMNNNYYFYLNKGKQKYLFDTYLDKIRISLDKYIGKREFNKIINDLRKFTYE